MLHLPHRHSPQFGDAVRNIRTTKGWTLADMEARTGVVGPILSKIERGISTPRQSTWERIVEGINKEIDGVVVTSRDTVDDLVTRLNALGYEVTITKCPHE